LVFCFVTFVRFVLNLFSDVLRRRSIGTLAAPPPGRSDVALQVFGPAGVGVHRQFRRQGPNT
jgi:hypothetical protein